MVRLSENFLLSEYTKSQTATRKGIDNTPGSIHLDNAQALFTNVVQKIRDKFGVTIITSGYRSGDLNYAIGGSNTSQHCKGQAVDIECPGTPNYDVAKWIEDNLEFDQLILEFYKKDDPAGGWVHVSYNRGANRMQRLRALKEDGKTVYKPGLSE